MEFVQPGHGQSCPTEQHPIFQVAVEPSLGTQAVSGRLIIMMSNKAASADKLAPSFGPDAHSVWVAAKEVHGLSPMSTIDLDPTEEAYPAAFCTAPSGNYKIKAVLDVDHNFAYSDDASDGDLVGVAEQQFEPNHNQRISVTLSERKSDPQLQPPPHTEIFDFVSPKLTNFWGRPIHMRGAVLVPPGYSSGNAHYPTAYLTHEFGGNMRYLVQRVAANTNKLMEEHKIPEMIWSCCSRLFQPGHMSLQIP
ncbi:MAG TPA: hypothetical protein VLK33_22265 [Terriglobales bacterium]|nr:hypothetical protein [Terriglobales bacterium]